MTDQPTPSQRAGLRDEIARAIHRYDNEHALSGNDIPSKHHRGEADHVLTVLYREWPWLRAEAEECPSDSELRRQLAAAIKALGHSEAALARVRTLMGYWAKRTDQLKRAAELLADALDQPEPPPGPAATEATETVRAEAVRQVDAGTAEPHTGLVVQPYTENGVQKWVFRCWGTDDGCDGWLSLDHYSQQSAERARDRHAGEEHGAPGPAATEATEEQQLVHALGGDRTAEIIAHTLTVHGHTPDAVRTMTDAELFAVPGIGGPSLARIRAALDSWPEPDGADQAEPEEQPLVVPRGTAAALHEALGQLLGDEGALAVGRVRALHHDWEADPGHCAHCNGPDGNLVRFPCATIRALDGEEQPGA